MGNQLRFFICDYTFSMSSQLETRLQMSHKKAHCHYPSAALFCVFFFFLIFAWQWLLSSKRFSLAKISFLHFSQSVAAYLQLSWLILKAGSGLPIKYLKRTFGWYYSLLVCFFSSLYIRCFGQCLSCPLVKWTVQHSLWFGGCFFILALTATSNTSVFDVFDIQWIWRMARKQRSWKLSRTLNVFFFFFCISSSFQKNEQNDIAETRPQTKLNLGSPFYITFCTNMSFLILKSSRRFLDADCDLIT